MVKMFPRILACGDSALSVELSDTIDEAVSERVIALARNLADAPVNGVAELVPTYRSLMVFYDPETVRGHSLAMTLRQRLDALVVGDNHVRRFHVPVVYGGTVGMDLQELADMKELTVSQLIELHASAEYRVFMIGFAPGFAYLGGLPEILHTPRRATPRQRIEASAIGIGGKQASINSVPGPSGWRFLGRTPLRLFDPARAEPFLLKAGDRVTFRPVSEDEAETLDRAIAAGRMTGEAVLQ
ncbi:5-oxoprolinase subunit PxpB [Rhizobium sullae]|uniref:KipI family sensor histidine kinase inhibitor n=1 Tax=Rhizobium sullae TaxID=50338 RepID=A0A4R3PVN0_RHISU|nr:5-oxoprolinase subunit PxpB [Rhizobium sullae]TCU12638.1 KipI family sensor histidine kinase inhibitor [Rhizobium sullae]